MDWPLNCVKTHERLAKYTSFRIGGPAEWFMQPSTIEELLVVVRARRRHDIPLSVIGGGTNLLVADRGLRGLVVQLGARFRQIRILSADDAPEVRVRCGASVLTQQLVAWACRHGWDELETLAGLPGQIGGAVAMNAQQIGRFVDGVTVISQQGEVETLTAGQIHFQYRYTAMKPGVIVEVSFCFAKADPVAVTSRVHAAVQYRNTTQDVRWPSAGCAFKNPPGLQAGRLIDEAGLKGTRIGDAQVSQRHANFIVNRGRATCDDVLSLMDHVRHQVARRAGVQLEPEVRVLGERWG